MFKMPRGAHRPDRRQLQGHGAVRRGGQVPRGVREGGGGLRPAGGDQGVILRYCVVVRASLGHVHFRGFLIPRYSIRTSGVISMAFLPYRIVNYQYCIILALSMVLLTGFLAIGCEMVQAADDDIDVSILDEINDTLLIPVGKPSIDLRVSIGDINCREYFIEYYSPFFLFSFPITENGNINANSSNDYQIDINRSAIPGYYNVTFKTIITMEENITRTLYFNKTFSYMLTLEILDVQFPSNYERTVQITINTHLFFNEISLIFNTDGDVGIAPEIITYTNLSQGIYQFNGTVYQWDIGYGSQEIGYKIVAFYDSQFFEIIEENVNVVILWEEEDQDEQKNTNWAIPLILFIFLCLINLLFYYLWKRGRNC